MKKYIIISLVVLGVVLTWFYIFLGGTEKLSFTVESGIFWVKGEHIRARYSDSKIEDLFFQARGIAESDQALDLAVINYMAPTDTVDQVIGIVSPIEISHSIEKLDTEEKLQGKFIKATINAHNLVMPKPEEVKGQAAVFAKDNNLSIDERYTLEVYKNERDLEVYIPVKD